MVCCCSHVCCCCHELSLLLLLCPAICYYLLAAAVALLSAAVSLPHDLLLLLLLFFLLLLLCCCYPTVAAFPYYLNFCRLFPFGCPHPFYFLLQVYNEQIKDLITKDPFPKDIKILHDPKLGVVIKGIREQVVRNPQEVTKSLSQILGRWEAEIPRVRM